VSLKPASSSQAVRSMSTPNCSSIEGLRPSRSWRVVLGSGEASPYRDSSSHGGRLITIDRPESRRLILKLLNS
jgi:hypothetical protein